MSANASLDPTLQRMEYGRALKGELLMGRKAEGVTPYAQLLFDAVSRFEKLGIGYALVGGIAAMYYGRARFTEDVDFVASVKQATLLESIFASGGVRVAIRKDEHADQIIARSHPVKVAGGTVQVIDVLDLIAMKLRAHRLKDDYDISEILLHNVIDEGQLRARVVAEQFSWFQEIKKRM